MLGGVIFYPGEQAVQVMNGWRELLQDMPDELSKLVNLTTAPPAPFLPENWHYKKVVALAVQPLRTLGMPITDLLGPLPYLDLQQLVDPLWEAADGSLVRASASENSELFWALRGGGGGWTGPLLSEDQYADWVEDQRERLTETVISIWHSKYVYGFWRPITAIPLADTDGNSKTIADLNWQPMLATPPYPDYVSGYVGPMSALIRALQDTSDTQHLQLTLTSTAVPNVTRFYDSGKVACQEVVDARVWLGIHFRSADVRGERMGEQVAEWALDRYFRPVSSP